MKARTLVAVLVGGALLTVGAVGAWATTSKHLVVRAPAPTQPITASRFALVVDGTELATFSELVAVESGVEPAEFLTASPSGAPNLKQLPANRKPPTVVLKRAMTGDLSLMAWHEAILKGNMSAARKSASLVMFAADGKPVARYYLVNAWPSKMEIGGLKAGASEALLETVTLVAENIQRVAP